MFGVFLRFLACFFDFWRLLSVDGGLLRVLPFFPDSWRFHLVSFDCNSSRFGVMFVVVF